ncbi:MAG: DNA ligase D [Proteobacteria bacterium]|nr:DNA ligase D [Pseudomonadota bacterium]
MARTADALATYNAKRRFSETPEPRGAVARTRKKQGGLYTIQKHDATRLHYDLRLELNGVLKSWAITKGPSLDPAQKRLAVRTEDHPMNYATFEGRIPEGNYGAGTVLLWDKGSWEPIGDAEAGLKKGKLAFTIHGKRLKGRWALVRMHAKKAEKRENWLMIKEVDDEVERGDGEITVDFQKSVASGRNLKQIETAPDAVWKKGTARKTARKKKHGKLPAFHAPALATLVDAIPASGDWLYEVKLDGYRAITAASGEAVRIYTRSGLDWTAKFHDIAEAIQALGLDGALLDGEICAVDDDGRANFSLLQEAIKGGHVPLAYFVFDLLALKGKSLCDKPIETRKAELKTLLKGTPRQGPIFFNDHLRNHGQQMLESLCRKGFEGVIAKRAASAYPQGRSNAWLKIKCEKAQEFVIVGWSPSQRGRAFSSILLGLYEGNALRYAGRVGSGFGDADLGGLAARFRKIERKSPAVVGEVPAAIKRKAHWLEPKLVAHIEFAEFTRDRIVRQGRFIALREDKKAKEVVAEMPKDAKKLANGKIAGITLSHPDKILFPKQGVSKFDLATYLEAVSSRMLPYLKGRLLSLVRCPEGRAKQCFFQRHAGAGLSEHFHRLKVKEKDGGWDEYLYLENAAGLVAAAQMSTLEFHVWGSTIKDIEKPERIVFDLDPDEDLDFAAVRGAAKRVRELLGALGLKSYPLMTGGKGVHVVAPIRPQHDWPVVKAFAGELAARMAADAPADFVATMSKAKRRGRIFIDHFRNERGATAIAPYSPRAREGAPVAWPVSWAALGRLDSAAAVTFANYRAFLKKPDPWEGYDRHQGLKASALRALKIDF